MTPQNKQVAAYSVLISLSVGQITTDQALAKLVKLGATPDQIEAVRKGLTYEHTDCICCSKIATTQEENTYNLPVSKGLWKVLTDLFNAQHKQVLRTMGLKAFTTKQAVPESPDLSGWDKQLAKDARPFIELEVDKGGKRMLIKLGIAADDDLWNVTNPKVADAIDDMAFALAKTTNDTTTLSLAQIRTDLQQALRDEIVTGDNLQVELTKRVNAIFKHATKTRAERIAWTESSRATHTGQFLAAKESKVVWGFEWLLSANACPICLAIKAEHPGPIKLGDKFAVIGTSMLYKNVRFPPAHPYCRCTVLESLTDD